MLVKLSPMSGDYNVTLVSYNQSIPPSLPQQTKPHQQEECVKIFEDFSEYGELVAISLPPPSWKLTTCIMTSYHTFGRLET